MTGLKYNQVTRYQVTACCEGPLHIGSAIGGKEEVLIDPVENKPFVQASSIAGVFRSYCKDILKDPRSEKLFGTANVEQMSRIRFEDGHFNSECKMEYRPHVSINKATGSVNSEIIKGTNKKSGQKFNMEYVGAGSEITFEMYLYEDSDAADHLDELVTILLSAMKEGLLQFGAKKSSGSGTLRLKTLRKKTYDLKVAEARKAWIDTKDSDLEDVTNQLTSVKNEKYIYEITVEGSTENYILVKGLAISGTGKDAPDCQNMQNAQKEFIVPGSSLRGAIRSQMEKIAKYLNCENVIETAYGKVAEGGKTGNSGNLIFKDTVIGDTASNTNMPIEHRIHIDKFTGGVIDKGLFNEKNAAGDIKLNIDIVNRNNPEKTLALLMFALRDLAIGTMSLGSGYSVGKGIIQISKISVKDIKNNQIATLTYEAGKSKLKDNAGVINSALAALKGGCA